MILTQLLFDTKLCKKASKSVNKILTYCFQEIFWEFKLLENNPGNLNNLLYYTVIQLVTTNHSGPAIFVRYNRVFVNNRVRYNRVSLCIRYYEQTDNLSRVMTDFLNILAQWFSTGVPRRTSVPRNFSRCAAKSLNVKENMHK